MPVPVSGCEMYVMNKKAQHRKAIAATRGKKDPPTPKQMRQTKPFLRTGVFPTVDETCFTNQTPSPSLPEMFFFFLSKSKATQETKVQTGKTNA